MYKTVVIEYFSKGGHHGKKVEKISNEMLEDGYELITMSKNNIEKDK